MKTAHAIVAIFMVVLMLGCAPPADRAPAKPEATADAATQVEPAKTGEMCGGMVGMPCADGLYCDYGDGTAKAPSHCGATDQSGVCAGKPQFCTRQYMPVCGCDGKTYGNDCDAHSNGVTIATLGECPAQ